MFANLLLWVWCFLKISLLIFCADQRPYYFGQPLTIRRWRRCTLQSRNKCLFPTTGFLSPFQRNTPPSCWTIPETANFVRVYRLQRQSFNVTDRRLVNSVPLPKAPPFRKLLNATLVRKPEKLCPGIHITKMLHKQGERDNFWDRVLVFMTKPRPLNKHGMCCAWKDRKELNSL